MKKNFILLEILVGKSLHISLADSSWKATKGVLLLMKGNFWWSNSSFTYAKYR